jgi:hypothetical protein
VVNVSCHSGEDSKVKCLKEFSNNRHGTNRFDHDAECSVLVNLKIGRADSINVIRRYAQEKLAIFPSERVCLGRT